MTKREAGALGGLETARKYGREYMARIGSRGGRELHRRYKLMPVGTYNFFLINRETGEFKAAIFHNSRLPRELTDL